MSFALSVSPWNAIVSLDTPLQSQIDVQISDFTSIRIKSHLNRTLLITGLIRTSELPPFAYSTHAFRSPKVQRKGGIPTILDIAVDEICRSISSLIPSTIFVGIYRRGKHARRSLRIAGCDPPSRPLFATTPHCHRASRRGERHSLLYSPRSICLADGQKSLGRLRLSVCYVNEQRHVQRRSLCRATGDPYSVWPARYVINYQRLRERF